MRGWKYNNFIAAYLGGARIVVAGPSAPVLVLLSVVGNAVSLAIDIDNTVGAGDTVTLQYAVSGTSFASPTTVTNTITSGQDTANEIDLSPAGFANGTYDFRASVTKVSTGLTSGWSNTIAATVSASSYIPTFYFLGF